MVSSRTQAACDSFCIGDEITKEASQSLDTVPSGWVPGRFRLTKSAANDGRRQLVQGTGWNILYTRISLGSKKEARGGGVI